MLTAAKAACGSFHASWQWALLERKARQSPSDALAGWGRIARSLRGFDVLSNYN